MADTLPNQVTYCGGQTQLDLTPQICANTKQYAHYQQK